MTHLELEEIEKLAKAATRGDWKAGGSDDYDDEPYVYIDIDPTKVGGVENAVSVLWNADWADEATAHFTAKMSPSTADRMVKRIRELEQVLEGLMKVCPLSGDMALMIRACQSGGTESAECADEMVAFYSGLDGAQDKARAALAVSGEDVGK